MPGPLPMRRLCAVQGTAGAVNPLATKGFRRADLAADERASAQMSPPLGVKQLIDHSLVGAPTPAMLVDLRHTKGNL